MGIHKWTSDGRKLTGVDWNELVTLIEEGSLKSDAPDGAYPVTNLYIVIENGNPKLKVEYET